MYNNKEVVYYETSGGKKLFGLKSGTDRKIYKFLTYNNFSNDIFTVPYQYIEKKISENYIKKFICSEDIIIPKPDNKQYVEVKRRTQNMNKINIIDNGGAPFLVYYDEEKVLIYRTSSYFHVTNYEDYVYTELVTEFEYKNMYTPKEGFTVLFEKDKNRFIFVGLFIYSFELEEKIISYTSIMGNNSVPYSYISTKNYIYLLEEKKYIKKNLLPKDKDTIEGYYSCEEKDKNNINYLLITERI